MLVKMPAVLHSSSSTSSYPMQVYRHNSGSHKPASVQREAKLFWSRPWVQLQVNAVDQQLWSSSHLHQLCPPCPSNPAERVQVWTYLPLTICHCRELFCDYVEAKSPSWWACWANLAPTHPQAPGDSQNKHPCKPTHWSLLAFPQ